MTGRGRSFYLNARERAERAEQPAGFTFIEIMVTMGLMVLLIGITYPLLEHWTEGSLRKAGRQVTAVMEGLYERAVVTRQIYRLMFDVGSQHYRPEVLQMTDGVMAFVPLAEDYMLPVGVRILDVVTAQQVKISEGQAAVYFYPIGRLDAVIIHLEQRAAMQVRGSELSLMPHPLTGRVTVSAGDIEFGSS